MARSKEVDHLEKVVSAARKVLDHTPLTPTESEQEEAEAPERRQEA